MGALGTPNGRKRVVVLGSTGSIGTQTLDVIREHSDRLELVGIAAHSNAALLAKQAAEFGISKIALADNHTNMKIAGGMQAICDLATMPEADIVVVSVAGVVGLVPTLAAIDAGKDIALASKEVLVAAGEIVMPRVRHRGIKLTPIDSEHSAIFQCLQGQRSDQIDELILTASGGPFRGRSRQSLESVTVQEALNHPTWSMGGKITIDSATLMNKGLESIEARWLFDVPMDRVKAVVHPESIVHSFVKFNDGSVLGQLGWPNMRLPILYALLHPDRVTNSLRSWDPIDSPALHFEAIDEATFPALRLARQSVATGQTMPCAMNAANEEAANAFLRGEVRFLQITEIVDHCMNQHRPRDVSFESLIATDAETRLVARRMIEHGSNS